MKNSKKAFTLVELLIVVGIIGVLISLLLPALGGSQKNAQVMKSKTLLTSIATALEQYYAEYAFFPEFLSVRERINLEDGNNSEYLVKTLTGVSADGVKLSNADRRSYNRKAKNFMEFKQDNLVQRGGSTQWNIVDALGNPNIYVCVDNKNTGFIKLGLPTTADGLTSDEVADQVPNTQLGVRSKVLLFTLKKDAKKSAADYGAENIFSW